MASDPKPRTSRSLDQELHDLGVRSRRVLPGFVEVLIRHRVGALGPVGAHQHPGARRDAAVLGFPGFHERHGEKEIRVRRRLPRAVDHAGGRHEVLDGNRVGGVVRQVAARDPVDRRIEVRAGVLAAGEVVPVPARPALVVARDLLDTEGQALAHLGRQDDLREVRRQRLGQVDHPDAAGGQIGDQVCQCRVAHFVHRPELKQKARARAPWDCRASAPATPARRRPGTRPRRRRAAPRR